MRRKILSSIFIVLFFLSLSLALGILKTTEKTRVRKDREIEQDLRVVDVFQGNFSPSNAVILRINESSDIAFSIKPIVDALNTTITFYLPADMVQLVDGELTWSGEVKKDEEIWLNISIKATYPMSGNIRARVMGFTQDGAVDQSYYLSVSTEEFGFLEDLEKDRIPMRKLEPGRRTISSQEFQAPNPGCIDVQGIFSFNNEFGGYSPMRYVMVTLFDTDLGLLAESTTDSNGAYLFHNVLNDKAEGLDICVVVLSASEAAITVDAGGYVYGATTWTLQNVADGTHDFGSLSPSMYNEAWQSMDAVITEYLWIESEVGWTRSQVVIWWPFGSWPSTNGNLIDLPDKASVSWDHITVHHEYGHCVMFSAYENSWPPTSFSGGHYVFSETDGGFALTEGWAEFMQCAVDNNPGNLAGWSSGHGGNIEVNDWYNCIDTGDMDGDIIEGSVASILWDIFDPYNDDGLSMGFDEIWTIIGVDNPSDIHSFWDLWGLHGYGQVIELNIIYWNYGIEKIPYISISVDPGDIEFGTIYEGGSGTSSVTITNDGNVEASIEARLESEEPVGFYTSNLKMFEVIAGYVLVEEWNLVLPSAYVESVSLQLTIPHPCPAEDKTAILVFWAVEK